MQALSLHDDVDVEIDAAVASASAKPDIAVTASFAPDALPKVTDPAGAGSSGRSRRLSLPQGAGNIAYRAAEASLRRWGAVRGDGLRVRIHIAKRIPMAAGLAGGSADAAAVILALARMLSPETPLEEIIGTGAEVGADVSFCISAIAKNDTALGYAKDGMAASSVLCEGIGDELNPAPSIEGYAVLVKPAIDVSTPAVYAAWDRLTEQGQADGKGGGKENGNADGAVCGNDLEGVAINLFPEIGILMADVKALTCAEGLCGAEPCRIFMTGSGPALVALYTVENDAAAGYDRLSDAYKNRAGIDAVIFSKLL
jgi:4-diphosphocytidyl-2-C-methyl-D-erythritol kinase